MVDVYNYIIRVVNILTFIYLHICQVPLLFVSVCTARKMHCTILNVTASILPYLPNMISLWVRMHLNASMFTWTIIMPLMFLIDSPLYIHVLSSQANASINGDITTNSNIVPFRHRSVSKLVIYLNLTKATMVSAFQLGLWRLQLKVHLLNTTTTRSHLQLPFAASATNPSFTN